MVFKIYGAIYAECTQRIDLVCKELGVPYELVTVDLANKEHKSPEWLANMQPFGQIPVLVISLIYLFYHQSLNLSVQLTGGGGRIPHVREPCNMSLHRCKLRKWKAPSY